MQLLLNWILSAVVIAVAAFILPGVTVDNVAALLVAAVVLGVINAIIKPIVLLLTLPLNILTFGLLTFVINALLVLLASAIVPGFTVTGFWWALLFSIVVSLITTFLYTWGRPTAPLKNNF